MHRNERLNTIIAWAASNSDLRVMLITSSLVNPLAPVDDFSDLDIELVFTDPRKYASDEGWLRSFGTPIAVFNETDVKMILFEDKGKVDFILHDIPGFMALVKQGELPAHWDIGYKVLVDKDGLTNHLKPPTFQASIIKKPTKERFEKLLFDFWWDTTYVAKSLARDEIFHAKYMSETIIRTDYLLPLIEWYIASQHDWHITTNKQGRLFKKHLPQDMWAKLERTFSAADIEGNRKALSEMMDLVHEIGSSLATVLGYEYPAELENRIRAFNS